MALQIQTNMAPSRSTVDFHEDGPILDAEDKRILEFNRQLKQKSLKTPYLLGWPSVVCIIANRMIGTSANRLIVH